MIAPIQTLLFDYAAIDAETRIVVQVMRDRKRLVRYPCRIAIPGAFPPEGEWVIYALCDPRSQTPYYIGKTCQFLKRMRAHCQVLPSCRPRFGEVALAERKMEIDASGEITQAVILASAVDAASASRMELLAIQRYGRVLLNTVRHRWEIREISND